jgi:hypothetical protein
MMIPVDPDPQAMRSIRDRIQAIVTAIVKAERTKAVDAGIPGSVFAEGALHTLLGIAARVACSIVFPGEAPESRVGRARVARVQRGLAQACVTLLAREPSGTENS